MSGHDEDRDDTISAAAEAPIPAGQARITVASAIIDVLAAVARLERVSIAVARTLDQGANT